jgi:hypothetical protein
MRGRRTRHKRGRNLLIWLAPLLVAALALLLSPREGAGEEPQGKIENAGGKLEEGRHFDWVSADSLSKLMDRIDPQQKMARRVQTADTFRVFIGTAAENPEAVRIFLNRRDPVDYPERLADDSPFAVRPQSKRIYGFHFPRKNVSGRVMVPVPFDMLAGLLKELEERRK